MKKRLKVLSTLMLVGMLFILGGCSSKGTLYENEGGEVRIIGKKQIEQRVNVSSLSYWSESFGIKEEKDGHYLTDPSNGLNWEIVIHKDDPSYDEFLEDIDYYVNTRGFDLEEKDSTIIARGEVDEELQSEFGFTFHEYYKELDFTDTGIVLDGEAFTEVK